MDSQAQQSDKALALNAVSKSFGKQRVLNEISFGLNPNQLTLLLGQNGSGKTTLLRICAGLSSPDSGSRAGAAITKPIAYLGHHCGLYSAMSVRENLVLTATLTKTTINLSEFISDWGLGEFADKLVGELSKGQQMRAGLGRAFLRAPSLVLLDEPSAALDDASTKLLLGHLKETAKSTAVLVATHDISRFESQAERVLVLKDGAIVKDSAANSSIAETIQHYRSINR